MGNKLSSHPLLGSLRAFGGIKAYNNGLVNWMVTGQKGWTVEDCYKIHSDLQYGN